MVSLALFLDLIPLLNALSLPLTVQMTSTGTGISHSEYNRNPLLPVHFLQIWALPGSQGLKPNYYNRHFTDEEKRNKLVQIVGPVGSAGVIDERNTNGPAPVRFSHLFFDSFPTATHRVIITSITGPR
jgi:redox-sensitive bicupin YhaK (pirin superfamily)